MSRAHNFTMIFNESMSRIDDPNAQLVFYWLCSFRNSISDLCCPSINTVCRKCYLSKSSVIRALKYLIELEILEKKGKNGDRNKYLIKDNKNKALKQKRCHTDTGVTQTLTGVTQTPVLKEYNKTNKKTTANYPPPLSFGLQMVG